MLTKPGGRSSGSGDGGARPASQCSEPSSGVASGGGFGGGAACTFIALYSLFVNVC